MTSKRAIILALMALLMLSFSLHGQRLEEEKWEETVDGVQYIEKSEKKEPKKKNEPKEYEEDYEIPEPTVDTKFSELFSTIMLILIIGVLLIVITLTIVKNPSVNKQAISVNSLTEEELQSIEENLFENDLERYIHEAKTQKNYKLAVRFSFLYVIRLLAEQELIKWKKEKTNAEYELELNSEDIKSSFQYNRFLFDHVWYGKVDLKNEALFKILTVFSNDIDLLKSRAANG